LLPCLLGLGLALALHLLAVVAVEAVAFDDAALTFSRRKMFSKVRVTEVVPAPDEPVMAMMGWRSDMVGPWKSSEPAGA
jgi:hypothetical protein